VRVLLKSTSYRKAFLGRRSTITFVRRASFTADRAEILECIAYARTPCKLPDILSVDEVVQLLEAAPPLKARASLTTAYAAVLRASETVSLKLADLNSDRMLIQVRHGKGGKDRAIMLSPQLLGILRTYSRLARPPAVAVPNTRRQADRCPEAAAAVVRRPTCS
jgi:site-specific recombinase XerD